LPWFVCGIANAGGTTLTLNPWLVLLSHGGVLNGELVNAVGWCSFMRVGFRLVKWRISLSTALLSMAATNISTFLPFPAPPLPFFALPPGAGGGQLA
jgi:hypothetical protein